MRRFFPILADSGSHGAPVARFRKLALGILTLASTVLASCGGDSGSSGPTVPIATVPITITLSADQQTIQAGATARITATVSNDAANRGVTWTVSCAVAPCGTVSPSSTASGAATTYTASATSPAADLAVQITATSVSD